MARKWSRRWWALQLSAAAFACALAAGGALAAVKWWRCDLDLDYFSLEAGRGRIEVAYAVDRDTLSALLSDMEARREWPSSEWNLRPWIEVKRTGVACATPLWLQIVLTGAIAAVTWVRHGPLRERWECSRCGYDLRGGRAEVCPECGGEIRPKAPGPSACLRS